MQDYFTIHNMGVKFERPESGIAHPGNPAPFGAYKTKDGYIAIAMNSFEKLVEALGDDSLMKYNDSQVLFEKRDEIFYQIEEITVTKTTEEWLEIMLGLDLWVAQVNDQADVADDPQVKHNKTFVEIEHPKAGKLTVTHIPFTMSETPGAIRRPSPMIGEHGPEILKELGYDEADIRRLIDEKILSVEKLVTEKNKI
jgi:crotonobetainyl-CoA:carnitine CoA-transferase CaiB-like acyl-CoA transferase